ncbi:lysophospholipid acyltransferase family protein [Phorcysia thermohydrogeniphila]|uniref:DUF374 domain-containing protein n=1 Tax=Phorcysia thermohydrogeniphila TaxID=936138 RepID=A0A4R1GF10_9BACT|nr:lysophospholipid acyltransferase family protein [Phorcysia thermohydrogeniphila]TCK05205.1 hypothetical protein CLV27_0631 [Phorcysia thermohydrogeniphila]
MRLSKPYVASLLLRAWVKTLKVEVEFLAEPTFPSIIAFWHGRMFLLPFVFRSYASQVSILISRHRDGEFATRLVEALGFSTVRGSTGKGKGGDRAFLEMVRLLKSGMSVAITPDGPRGPREVVKPGVARLSIKTGVPIYPLTFSCSRGKKLNSWDRFLIPYPFSRCKVILGKPIYPQGYEEEELVKKVELELQRLTETCDGEMGWKA